MASGAADLVVFQRQMDKLRSDLEETRRGLEASEAAQRSERIRRTEAEKLVEVRGVEEGQGTSREATIDSVA